MTIAVTHRRPSVVLAITFCVVLLVSVSAGFALACFSLSS